MVITVGEMTTERRVKWVYSDAPDPDQTRALSEELGLPQPIVRILLARNLDSADRITHFLNPEMAHLFDPFNLSGMREAVDRLVIALQQRDKIIVYGDYDVDGITSTALMFLVLNRLGAEVEPYLPNRLVEGYGLSSDGIDYANSQGAKLILTVDCGITAVEEVEYARSLGIEVVITDHHEPGSRLPNAVTIVNPKLDPVNQPGQELAGVGVAFKLAQALYRTLGQNENELEEHLDLVALGTTADIVPLVGENRTLTRFGIRQLERTNKPGLKSLCFVSNLMGRQITTGQIVFILAPRINAVGRLGNADLAIKLLSTRDDRQASELARTLDRENRTRKSLDENTLRQALAQIENNVDLKRDRAIVLYSEDWHQGVIGIVASRLVEKYHLPTVMISIDGDEGRGSARSIPAFHVYEALRECEDLILRYGGHKYAAGLSIHKDRIPEFAARFKSVANRQLTDDDLIPKLAIDCYLDLDDLSDRFLDHLESFAPFGPQNTRPVFMAASVSISGNPFIVGTNHLKFKATKGNRVFDCIGFNMGERAHELMAHSGTIDLVYVPEKVTWNHTERLQLRVKDFALT
ncbi:MAG: single-stranded-DNA-specific exonuclease RecJ [Candidatus Zixiibacteriota bacterium]